MNSFVKQEIVNDEFEDYYDELVDEYTNAMFIEDNGINSDDEQVELITSAEVKTCKPGAKGKVKITTVLESPLCIAEKYKLKGNDLAKSRKYSEALGMYDKAIEIMPNQSVYHGNKWVCYNKLNLHKEALSAIRTALEHSSNNEKNLRRLISTTILLGLIDECEISCIILSMKMKVCKEKVPEYEKLQQLDNLMKEIKVCEAKNGFLKVIDLASQALQIAKFCNDLKLTKASAFLKLRRFGEAEELCREILVIDKEYTDAIFLLGTCLYQQAKGRDFIDSAIKILQEGLQYSPRSASLCSLHKSLESVQTSWSLILSKMVSGEYAKAQLHCKLCLSLANDNINLQTRIHYNLAVMAHALGQLEESVQECGMAISLNPTFVKAFVLRGQLYSENKMHAEAFEDFKAASKIDPKYPSISAHLRNAKLEVFKTKRKKDYYKILEVGKRASQEEIRKAYRVLARQHHPDKHANAAEEEKLERTKEFQDISAAYEVLCDSMKRQRYDLSL